MSAPRPGPRPRTRARAASSPPPPASPPPDKPASSSEEEQADAGPGGWPREARLPAPATALAAEADLPGDPRAAGGRHGRRLRGGPGRAPGVAPSTSPLCWRARRAGPGRGARPSTPTRRATGGGAGAATCGARAGTVLSGKPWPACGGAPRSSSRAPSRAGWWWCGRTTPGGRRRLTRTKSGPPAGPRAAVAAATGEDPDRVVVIENETGRWPYGRHRLGPPVPSATGDAAHPPRRALHGAVAGAWGQLRELRVEKRRVRRVLGSLPTHPTPP